MISTLALASALALLPSQGLPANNILANSHFRRAPESLPPRPAAMGMYVMMLGLPEQQGWTFVDHDPGSPNAEFIKFPVSTNLQWGYVLQRFGTSNPTPTKFWSRLGETFRFSEGFYAEMTLDTSSDVDPNASYYIAAVDSDNRAVAIEIKRQNVRIIHNVATGAYTEFPNGLNTVGTIRLQLSININGCALGYRVIGGQDTPLEAPLPSTLPFQMSSRVWFGDGATLTANNGTEVGGRVLHSVFYKSVQTSSN